MPNNHWEQETLFRWIDRFVTSSKQVALEGDWNSELDPDLDRKSFGKGTNIPSTQLDKYLTDFPHLETTEVD